MLPSHHPTDMGAYDSFLGSYDMGQPPFLSSEWEQPGQTYLGVASDLEHHTTSMAGTQHNSNLDGAVVDSSQYDDESQGHIDTDGACTTQFTELRRTNTWLSDVAGSSDAATELSEFSSGLLGSSKDHQHHPKANSRDLMVNRTRYPFAAQLLSEDWNRLSIKKGLLKIYHDSMEGALSCWLTERNCPYSSQVFDGREVWSSNWANRIATRVCDLDTVYCSTGALSLQEQTQASKVLNTVVMAFAAQWSQTGERSSARLSSSGLSYSKGSNLLYCDPTMTAEDDIFGRDMQKNLWHQASKALHEASENKSFRVIFAGIIFSLAQRPVDTNEILQGLDTRQRGDLVPLFEILDLDGAPICLDVALRKLLDHQRSMTDGRDREILEGVHKETFGLLCWLAIMFDTLSAAVNRRAFAVGDEDSNFDSAGPPRRPRAGSDDLSIDLDGWPDLSEDAGPAQSPAPDIWGDYFLRQTSQAGDIRNHKTRWPCSYNEAASCLADAAPVKVLLFRRVAQLQNLSFRRTSGLEIERALEAAMQVYTHWNRTYGRFIDDCIRHHEHLPVRIQSWYILLAGHWNLAVLILSNVVQKLDDQRVTLPSQRHSREAIEFTRALRTRAAFAVSDLGRCSRYGDEDLTFSQSPDFHHAVNKAALLTEPWTTVLVRSFGYAGAFLARQVLCQSEPALLVDASGARERLQHCIDALWLLGKKSDMALCAAQVLRQSVC